ncbi:MAG: methyltransferase domain-containing protein [Chloroflexi bacterium]|nr:methyltransferase domain-containing protein [Chloroflexota bacterium]
MSLKLADPNLRKPTSQMAFYRDAVDPEEEIERPRGYPRAVQFLLDFKVRRALAGLDRPLDGLSALVVCGGSGMDGEKLESSGLSVTVTDLSADAIERARRHGLAYRLVAADATRLPFRDRSFDIAFVHDGLHHLPDPSAGIAEMCRVARLAIVVAEPQREALTRLALALHMSCDWEDAGNYVFRLRGPEIARIATERGFGRSAYNAHLVYYQPWTFPIYRLLSRDPLYPLFQAGFHLLNRLVGRWGNSLKFVAWRNDQL